MTFRVLLLGAVASAPFLTGAALAQTATTPAATPSSPPARRRRPPRLRRRRDPAGLCARDPIARGCRDARPDAACAGCSVRRDAFARERAAESVHAGPERRSRRASGLGAAAPSAAQSSPGAPPVAAGRAAEAEESRAASAAARDRASDRSRTRRFSPIPSSPPPKRPSVTARSSTPAAGRPTSLRCPGTKGPPVTKLRKRLAIEGDLSSAAGGRPGVGQWAHRGGEALSGAHGTAADRNRLRRDAEGDQCSSEGAVQPSSPRAPIASPGAISRSTTAMSWSTCPRPRSRPSKTATSPTATSRSSATPSIPRPRSPRISRSSISTRPGRCRRRSSRRKSFRTCSATRAT